MGDFRRNLACTRVPPPSSAELGLVKRTVSLILHCLKAGSCAHKPISSASLSSPENDQADWWLLTVSRLFFFLDRRRNTNCWRWIKKNKKESFVHAKDRQKSATLVKTDPEFRWNPAGIPVRIFPEFQVDAGRIPPEFRWNPPELLPAFRRYSPGIPDISSWNSAGLLPAFCQYSTGIPAGIPPELLPAFRRYSTEIPAGIPPELLPAFHWNSSRNSAGIIAGILPEFRWNYCRHTAGISDNSSWNSTGIPDRNTAGIPELG